MTQQAAFGPQAEANPEEGAWFRGTEASGTQTVLLVEDEPFVRSVASEVLRAAGYRVLIAKDAKEASRAYDARFRAVDLLLTDIILPGENGRALAVRLRRENPRLKVLLITGYVEQMGQESGGIEECLAKPFSVDVLLRKVRQILDCVEPSAGAAVEHQWAKRACGNA
jgi:two-component system, cell cycle sensor histidine kinase and response regulator CckA